MELGKLEEEPQAHQPIREEKDTPRDGEEPCHLASMQEMHGPTEACNQQTQRGSTVTSQNALTTPSISCMIAQTEKFLGHFPICKTLGHCIHWWEKHSHPQVLKLVKDGISLPPMFSQHHQKHGQREINLAKEIFGRLLSKWCSKKGGGGSYNHLIPWFILSKQEGSSTKNRLISDCRELIQFVETKKFRLQNLHNIFPFLKKGDWSAKIDL
jgi:hypothetical protein